MLILISTMKIFICCLVFLRGAWVSPNLAGRRVGGQRLLQATRQQSVGAQKANHYIVTKYETGQHNIGFHFDKPKDIAPSSATSASLITVVKTGECGRPFELRMRAGEGERQESIRPFFSQALEPETAVIMTLEANLKTQHSVPVVEQAGPSGSIVFRTITRTVTAAALQRKLDTLQ